MFGGTVHRECKGTTKEERMTYSEERHTHSPEVREPEGSGLVGYAAIKYAAIVIIVLAILAFLAWYIIPRIG
jgi:cell division septal protein FtsQ